MRLAILSDIHGNYEALKKVILDIEQNKINAVIFLGDLVMKGPEPKEVFNALEKLNPICWLKGNTELWLSKKRTKNESNNSTLNEIELYRSFALKKLSKDTIDFMLNCPEKKSLMIDAVKMLCVHGSPRSIIEPLSPKANLKKPIKNVKEDIILCGHSHIPFVKKIGKKIIFNPGSVGCPYDGEVNASYGLMDLDTSNVQFYIKRINYSRKVLIETAKSRSFPNLQAYEKLIKEGKNKR